MQESSAVIGLSSKTHRESILIDRTGRLQLPKEAVDNLPFNGRAEVRITDDHVELWPIIEATENGNGNGSSTARNGIAQGLTAKKEERQK
jgi:hypothetical protein